MGKRSLLWEESELHPESEGGPSAESMLYRRVSSSVLEKPVKEGFIFRQVSPSSPDQTFGMEGARILVRSLKCEKSHFAFYTLVIRFKGLHSVEAGRSRVRWPGSAASTHSLGSHLQSRSYSRPLAGPAEKGGCWSPAGGLGVGSKGGSQCR